MNLEEHRRFLWGLCYRMTGVAADADDLVQETFLRALERPPARQDDPWRPWLTRVALNLGRDLLRRRRRRGYRGPWLPSPLETGDEAVPPSVEPTLTDGTTTEGRYDLLESVTFAFLLALEALTPTQRAVLLLRDVFDYSVTETATALGISEPNVKTTHHRARRAMAGYDRRRCRPVRALQERTRAALEQFLVAITGGDVGAVERLLAPGVRAVSDGAGETFAARKAIVGPTLVARFFVNIARRRAEGTQLAVREFNGLPGVVIDFGPSTRGDPVRSVTRLDVDDQGRVAAIHSVLSARKLARVA